MVTIYKYRRGSIISVETLLVEETPKTYVLKLGDRVHTVYKKSDAGNILRNECELFLLERNDELAESLFLNDLYARRAQLEKVHVKNMNYMDKAIENVMLGKVKEIE